MGVAWHEHVFQLVALGNELVEEHLHQLGNVAQLVASEQFQVDEHLVVARAPAVYLLAHVAQPAGEHQLHLRMDVFHSVLYLEAALGSLAVDGAQLGKQLPQLVGA